MTLMQLKVDGIIKRYLPNSNYLLGCFFISSAWCSGMVAELPRREHASIPDEIEDLLQIYMFSHNIKVGKHYTGKISQNPFFHQIFLPLPSCMAAGVPFQ